MGQTFTDLSLVEQIVKEDTENVREDLFSGEKMSLTCMSVVPV